MNTRQLIDALRHQIIRPQVTTMGACASGCGLGSRGARTCSACLMKDLSAEIGVAKADAVYFALRAYAEAWHRVDQATEDALA